MALRRFCTGNELFVLHDRTYRLDGPAQTRELAADEELFATVRLVGGIQRVDREAGDDLLVMMPVSAFGPEMPRNARFVNRALDASLSAIIEESSKE